jgi:pSer/pThr/pTyr-binding forkhead associated (FHA) protein
MKDERSMKDESSKNSNTDSIKDQEIESIKDISPQLLEELKKLHGNKAGLLTIKGPIIGEKFFLNKDSLSIGRSSESDILLDDITVSRHHAIIEKRIIENKKSAFGIRDLESLNGTYVNGEIAGQADLVNGDRVQVGKYVFLFFISE